MYAQSDGNTLKILYPPNCLNERIRTQPLLILVQFADSSVDLRVVIEVVKTLNRKETVEIIKSWWSQKHPVTFIGLNYLY